MLNSYSSGFLFLSGIELKSYFFQKYSEKLELNPLRFFLCCFPGKDLFFCK